MIRHAAVQMVFLKFSRAVADEAADGVDDDVIGDRDEGGNAAAELWA